MKTTLLFLSVFLSANLFSQNVYIPDANFKAYLVSNPEINTNNDTEIQVSEAESFGGTIFCVSLNISDLTGIEAFTALNSLQCGDNQLTTLDVSQNINLEYLGFDNNQLTSLDVAQNIALIKLWCGNNQLTSLDLSQNIALTEVWSQYNQLTSLDVSQNNDLRVLQCSSNQLTNLDVSQNGALEQLECSYNQLTSLDVAQNILLRKLMCNMNNQLTCLNVGNSFLIANVLGQDTEINTTNNPNLTCIEVDESWSEPQWTYLDPQTSFSENCNYPSDCFTSSLTELTTSKNLIQILDMMGRETSFKPNTPLIYVYDDGSTEKVFSVEY